MRTSEKYDFQILSHIQENPDTTQADIADQLGVAVGSVNWYIKRLITKGCIKVAQMQRRRLRYLLTPQGIAEKSRLMSEFLKASLKWYRITREDSKRYLKQVKESGYDTVCIEGDGDLAEIVSLTCMEAGVVVKDTIDNAYPVFHIVDFLVKVNWPSKD
ncbi:MAG: winged helix-turn-helix transcriptional regulator [Anaerolineae bacterium]|nr:winged helix-turn-helix transcriptional regulator [Anaerolineae bacterium]